MKKLMKKWGITSVWQFILINVVFALSGMFILYERKPIFALIGIVEQTPFWIKFIAWILIVFPCYQLNLLVFGFLLGQFKFFWNKEKQMMKALKRLFTGKKAEPTESFSKGSS